MTRVVSVVVVCWFMVCSLTVSAYAQDDNALFLESCQTYLRVFNGTTFTVDGLQTFSEGADWGICLGRVQGVLDMGQMWETFARDTAMFCVPEKLTYHQAVKVVVKYLTENPDEVHGLNAGLAFLAFRDAFPCTGE